MQSVFGVVTCVVFLLSIGLSQANPPLSLQPTPLEWFARESSVPAAWSAEVRRLHSNDAHAVVTAIVLEDTDQPPDRWPGIRIDLANQSTKEEVYLDEETLGVYKKALNEISHGAPQARDRYAKTVAPGGVSYFGAEAFWYGDRPARVLDAAYYFTSDSSGLALHAGKNAEFGFPSQDPLQLATAIERATDPLKSCWSLGIDP
jgi:hypothetical protein